MSVEFIAYKGYELAVTDDAAGWQVVIQPMSPALPARPRFLPLIWHHARGTAVEDAKRAVDKLLIEKVGEAFPLALTGTGSCRHGS
jgi:hypothetical protein